MSPPAWAHLPWGSQGSYLGALARRQPLLLADCHILAQEVLTQSTKPCFRRSTSIPRLMTQPIHTCPGGRERPAWGKERPGLEPPGPQTPASSDPGLGSSEAAEPGVARHERAPAAVLTIVYLPPTPQIQPSSVPSLFLCPRRPWPPASCSWVTAELSQWEMPTTGEGEEVKRGWFSSCWAPGRDREPRFPRATAPGNPLPQPLLWTL